MEDAMASDAIAFEEIDLYDRFPRIWSSITEGILF